MNPLRRCWTIAAFVVTATFLGSAAAPAAPGSRDGALGKPLWQRADAASRERVQDWVEQASNGWSPNRGQVAREGGGVATEVLYSTSAGDARVHVTSTGLTYFFLGRSEGEVEHKPGGEKDEGPRQIDWARVDMKLEGAVIRAESARPRRAIAERGVENFYLPHCPNGVLGVTAFAEVEFPDVYPGIDWIVRSEPGGPAHQDFVVRPGADPSSIRFTYLGAGSVEISEDGQSLRVRTALGEVREGALHCTQAGGARRVAARFVLDGDAVTVRVDDYIRTEPLVIDPPLVWSTYYGGSIFDGSLTLCTDNSNQTFFAVGYTTSANLPLLNGGGYYDGTYGTLVDGAIWKFTQLGVRQWVTYFGGTNFDLCKDATVDPLGNLYVVGETGSTDFPTSILGGAYNQSSLNGPSDGFIAKFSGTGALQWSTWFGGSSDESANTIAADPTGRIYVAGQTSSPDLPLANPGGGAYYDNAYNLSDDCWLTRFSTLGAMEWSTYLGGSNTEKPLGVTTGGGNVYVVGYTWSSNFPVSDPGGGAYYQANLVDQQDAFIMRFTLAGVLTWSTYLGGDDWDLAAEPLVKPSGNLLVVGYTRSSDFPTWNPGGGAYFDNTPNGLFDFFVTEFTAAANPGWGTYVGGSSDEIFGRAEAKNMTLDSVGQLYITAETTSSDFPIATPGGSYSDNSWSGSSDAVILRFGVNRALQWSTYFGTAATDFGTGIAVGVGDCMFATGESWEPGALVMQDPGLSAWFDNSHNGEDDVYFTKFCSPNSACCQDNTCVPAASQAQCFAMGGTAFYPGQNCSTVVCTILCTICGKKFEDLNRNGVQDGGEQPLANWTIVLSYPNGPVYQTQVTNAQGEYCFSGIPCGQWEVSERPQPGWVQTFPTTGAHLVTLGTGTTQNGVNFGNFQCASGQPCIPWHTGLAAWWPFGDGAGLSAAMDVTHSDPARNALQLEGGAVLDSAAICLGGPADGAVVPLADQLGVDFGEGAFSIAAWVNATPGIPGTRPIVEKRALVSPGGDTRGWSLALNGLQGVLTLGTGGAPQVVPGPSVTPGDWSHLAVTIDRSSGHGRWYLDGAPAAGFDFTPIAGDVTTSANLLLGKSEADLGSVGFHGCIADLALSSRALSAADVNKAWIPGPIGFCPEYALIPSITKFCQGQTTRQVCFNIVNNNPTTQTYSWSLAGLPANPPGCTNAGPTLISPSSGTVTLLAGQTSAAICVTITRPTGFTAHNATSCFSLTFVNTATGRCQTRTSKLRVDNGCYCATTPPGAQNVAARIPGGVVIGIPVGLPCDPIARIAYSAYPVWLDPEHPDPVALSLNGLPPGVPVEGELDGLSGLAPTLEFVARYPNGYDPAAIYEVVIEADTDGDGTPERLGGVIVKPTYETTQNTGVEEPGDGVTPPRLRVTPNPFFGRAGIELALPRAGALDVAIYDLGGRRVRTIARGRLEAGPHRLDWNGADDSGRRVAAGVYFVRVAGDAMRMEAKVVKLR